jgi:hypothetical protein
LLFAAVGLIGTGSSVMSTTSGCRPVGPAAAQ